MTSILSHFQVAPKKFRPESIGQYIVLQVARKLKDTENIPLYAHLLSEFSQEEIITVASAASDKEQFHTFLKSLRRSEHAATNPRSNQAA